MEKTNYIFLIAIGMLLLSSCEKEEDLWQLPPAGNETMAAINMGNDYEKVVFKSLSSGAQYERNLYSWHLAFSNNAKINSITLNGGAEVQVYNTQDTAFDKTYRASITSPWVWDNPIGHQDSLAFVGWFDTLSGKSKSEVYIIDLGRNETPRYKKCKIEEATNNGFLFKYANIDGSDLQLINITRKGNTNAQYLHLNNHQLVSFEPEANWDLIFTRYRHVFYEMTPITPYYVVGVLINTAFVEVTETSSITFENMNAEQAQQLLFNKKADEIGYDWKSFELNGNGKFTIDQHKIYIVKDKGGYLYKLKFLDFYDDQGTKGVPKFIYQRL